MTGAVGARTRVRPLVNVARWAPNAALACPAVASKEMNRWFAGDPVTANPWLVSQAVTAAASASLGANRARHCAALR